MVVILNNSSFQFSKMHAQFQECWHKKKLGPLCMAIVNSNEKNIIYYYFGNDFYFQNEEFSL